MTGIKIGTRGSPLALAQAEETRDRLLAAHPGRLDPAGIEIVKIQTAGDRIQDRALREVGGKGLFIKEVEEALLDGRVDIAVHSMKDMETELPDPLVIDCLLPREDVRDAFLSKSAKSLADLPAGAVVGTSSLRRRAMILNIRPDLQVVEFRGNVQTRLRKLKEGVADATLLAMAGLRRLGIPGVAASCLSAEEMLPAVAQGAIGIERRKADERLAELLAPLNDAGTMARVGAERAMLATLDGSCHTPIAALAELDGAGGLRLRGAVLRPDGTDRHDAEIFGPVAEAEALGRAVGETLLAEAGPGFFEGL